MNKSLKTIQNKKRYLHHLNSNFDSAICCSGLSHRCQWNRCLIGHGRQRNGNNEGDKTTSDSQWSLLHLDLKKNSWIPFKNSWLCFNFHSVRDLHFFPKIQLWFHKKIVDFFGWKTCENVVVWDFLAVDNFDFTKKIWVKNSWKCWGFVKIEFLDKNLTFRIMCTTYLGFVELLGCAIPFLTSSVS